MRPYYFIIALALLILHSCSEETEEYQTETIADYLPLQVGKYITYRTDSTVFTNFGRNAEVHSYQEKHLVEAQVTDALNRPSYRIMRFIRSVNASPSEHWNPAGTYFITPLPHSVEIIEDNLRFVKLALPIKQDFTWKGNSYLPDDPYGSHFNFSNDNLMVDWEYKITIMNESLMLNNQPVNNVITVQSIDESINVPITSPSSYAIKNYSIDKYAKGIGMVYQEFVMWEYQPNTGGSNGGYQVGFGVKRSMIDHK